MFEKTLSDLVKGLRSNKRRESEFVSKCISEIKDELSGKDKSQQVKANAVLKLTYLQMLGYDMQWSSFHIVEVMSLPSFAHKRIGYLGASVSYNDETEVVLLCTNMFKKDFSSANQYEVGLAINCLANICTTDLARDLVSDIVTLMSSNRAYVRKKAVLVMYKIFLKFPDALRPSFPKLKEKLEDRDTSAVSCAVNVICELARKNPQNYLALAPLFFKLLTLTANNWMLIKIVKLLGALCPLEPRLGKKLVEPLTNIIQTTPAKSLLYECIHTVSVGMTQHIGIVQLSMDKLKGFVEDEDQNLKYLGLLAMGNFMKVHPRVVSEHKVMILKCLDDEDVTIKHRALDLVSGMISKKNLVDIVRILMEHVTTAEGAFRTTLVDKVIEVCSANGYAAISSFEWYISNLCKLARMPGITNGFQIKQQLMDVIIRVKMVRPFGVKSMVEILEDAEMFGQSSRDVALAEVLYAAAWLSGEFAHFMSEGQHVPVMRALLNPRALVLPEHVQSVYVHNALKLLISASRTENPQGSDVVPASTGDLLEMDAPPAPPAEPEAAPELGKSDIDMLLSDAPMPPAGATPDVALGIAAVADIPAPVGEAIPETGLIWQLVEIIDERIGDFVTSRYVEVQERAVLCREIVSMIKTARQQGQHARLLAQLQVLFHDELNPVAPKAQSKVQVPAGLDLDARIHEEEEEELEEEEESQAGSGSEEEEAPRKKGKKDKRSTAWDEDDFAGGEKFAVKPSKKELKKMQKDADKERKKRMTDPFYLGGGAAKEDIAAVLLDEEEVEAIPVFRLSDDEDDGGKKKKKKKSKKVVESEGESEDDMLMDSAPVVDMGYEMPGGADSDDDKEGDALADEVSNRLNIDISKPLKADEVLPSIKQYERKSRYEVEEEERKRRKKEKKEKEKKKEEKKASKKDKKDKSGGDADGGGGGDIADLLDMGGDASGPSSAAPEAPLSGGGAASEGGNKGGDDAVNKTELDWFLSSPPATPGVQQGDAGKVEGGGGGGGSGEKKKKDKKDKKSKKDKKAKEESEEEEEEVVEKVSKKDRKGSKKGKDDEDKEWKKDKKSSKEDKKSSKKDSSRRSHDSADSKLPPPKLKPRNLGGDSRIKATYEAHAVSDSTAKNPPVMLAITLTNTGDCQLGPVTVSLVPSMNVRVSGNIPEVATLMQGDSSSVRIELQVASVNKPQKVKCTIKYEAVGEGAPAAPISVSCELMLPCSAFLMDKPMSPQEFDSLIANGACSHKSSVVMESTARPFKYTLQLLKLLLNLRVVEGMDGSASLYAQSLQGHHILILAKQKGGSTVSVDLRSNDESLCTQVCNEVSGLPLFIA